MGSNWVLSPFASEPCRRQHRKTPPQPGVSVLNIACGELTCFCKGNDCVELIVWKKDLCSGDFVCWATTSGNTSALVYEASNPLGRTTSHSARDCVRLRAAGTLVDRQAVLLWILIWR